MKKKVLHCQEKIDELVESPEIIENYELKKTLTAIQEGLTICISKTPSKKGFPFDLPAVEYVDKLHLSQNFFKTAVISLEGFNVQSNIGTMIYELQSSIDEFLCSDIKENIREIKTLNTYYVRLRQILGDDTQNTKQVKKKITILRKQIKKQQPKHSRLKIVTKRLEKYNRNLFHCYDNKAIPRTNLEIERSFNSLKRKLRKRTGFQNRPTFFSYEGSTLIKIENITSDFNDNFDEREFVSYFQAKALQVNQEELKKQSKERKDDKHFLKKNFFKKISLKKAGKMFRELKAKLC
ncbi:MAG: hypothetical protein ACFFDN_51555 [Candidatus Hodarchaeota archaeon]